MANHPQEANLPPDMLMMLGRMDGKLDSLLTQTAANTAELKDLTGRVGSLEADRKETGVLREQFKKVVDDVDELKTARSEAKGGWKGASMVGTAGKGALIALGTVCTTLGIQTYIEPKKHPEIKSEVSIERTLTLPKHP